MLEFTGVIQGRVQQQYTRQSWNIRFEDGGIGRCGKEGRLGSSVFLLHIIRQIVSLFPDTADQRLLGLMKLLFLYISQVKALVLRGVHIML